MCMRYVNGNASTTPMTNPKPGMIETAMPTSRPITNIPKSSGVKICRTPIPR